MKNIFLKTSLIITITLTSCSKVDAVKETDYNAQLSNIGNNVIVRTYEDLRNKAATLQSATSVLELNQTLENFQAVKNAWVAARSPWEQSEGFLFGPVDQEDIDPSIDSWPVNVIDLNNVLNSNNELTPAYLANQEGTLKGFHTIEFLLWGASGNKQITDFTPREFEYLKSCAANLASDTNKLYNLWSVNGQSFILNLTTAGTGNSIYLSQKSAVLDLTNAIIAITDEVANGKIQDPFIQQDVTLEESRFSANSKTDFSNNINSVKNIYTGFYNEKGNGSGLTFIVNAKNINLDAKIKTQIDDAILAIQSIPGTFTTAIVQNKISVINAQTKVRDLQQTLESELLPLINNL